ncbi:MAG: hypothetical protein H6563_07050 [Lewinellaceae bacterium]|nr:hypothetical protein [Lewinellaceae bacterium]
MDRINPFGIEPDPNQSTNIWGWKNSLISLGVILFFTGLVLVRWIQLGKPSMRGIPATEEPMQQDTLKTGQELKGGLDQQLLN